MAEKGRKHELQDLRTDTKYGGMLRYSGVNAPYAWLVLFS